MSHAVIRAGGQFLVEEGQTIRVPSIEADAGSSIELETLLSSGDGKISATVVAHGKDQKIVVFKKAPQTVQAHARPPAGLYNFKD